MSLESVEGMDPALLRKEREFLENRNRRERNFTQWQMPRTVTGKRIQDRPYQGTNDCFNESFERH